MEKERELANQLLDEIEDFLQEKGIKIPNKERDEYEADKDTEKSILFGSEYYALEDTFTEAIKGFNAEKRTIKITVNNGCVIGVDLPENFTYKIIDNDINEEAIGMKFEDNLKCPKCGKIERLCDWTYLKAGFNGIEEGDKDDLDKLECNHCEKIMEYPEVQ